MNENEMKNIINKDKMGTVPPEGLKDRIFREIIGQINSYPLLSPLELFVFRSPLRTALAFGAVVSVTLWISMGSKFIDFINRIMG